MDQVSRQSRRRPARTRRRGQSLVEFALLLPVFIVIIFGVVEYSLINASIGSYNFATQDAARFGAIIGPTDPNVDTEILNQYIVPRVAGIVTASIVTVEVFHAGEGGGCADGTTSFPCPQEDLYTAATGLWSNTWPVATRDDQLVTADYLGIRISYEYTYLTAFFATTSPQLNLTAISVQRIEPQEYAKAPTVAPVAAIAAPDGAPGAAVIRPVSPWWL